MMQVLLDSISKAIKRPYTTTSLPFSTYLPFHSIGPLHEQQHYFNSPTPSLYLINIPHQLMAFGGHNDRKRSVGLAFYKEKRLMLKYSDPNKLTLEQVHEKINNRYGRNQARNCQTCGDTTNDDDDDGGYL